MKEIFEVLAALVLTLAIELLIGGIWWRRWRTLVDVFLVNMLTNPIINIEMTAVSAALGGMTAVYWVILAVSEAAVVAAEGILLHKMLQRPLGRTMLFSLTANFASYFIGWLVSAVGIL